MSVKLSIAKWNLYLSNTDDCLSVLLILLFQILPVYGGRGGGEGVWWEGWRLYSRRMYKNPSILAQFASKCA